MRRLKSWPPILRRFMDDQPILARRPGMLERTLAMGPSPQGAGRHGRRDLRARLDHQHAAIWVQARKTEIQAHETELANQRRIAYLIESYPLLHRGRHGRDRGGQRQALRQANGRYGDSARKRSQTFNQWLRFFKQAIELPPNDPEIADRHRPRLLAPRLCSLDVEHCQGDPEGGLEPRLLAEALADYRRSVDLLEELLADSPGDPKIRRYLAEALGLGNMGCCLRMRSPNPGRRVALPPRDSDQAGVAPRHQLRRRCRSLPRAHVPGELDDLLYLVSTVHVMAGMLESKRPGGGSRGLRRQLKDDLSRSPRSCRTRDSSDRRQSVGQSAHKGAASPLRPSRQRDVMLNHRLALIIDPDNAVALNNLAWSLVQCPRRTLVRPHRGLALARKAVALEPQRMEFLEHPRRGRVSCARLGHRRQHLSASRATIHRRRAYNLFFLAMTYWHQGNKKDARAMYDRAVAWTDKHKPNDPELRKFCAEAADLLGQPCVKPGQDQGRPVANADSSITHES